MRTAVNLLSLKTCRTELRTYNWRVAGVQQRGQSWVAADSPSFSDWRCVIFTLHTTQCAEVAYYRKHERTVASCEYTKHIMQHLSQTRIATALLDLCRLLWWGKSWYASNEYNYLAIWTVLIWVPTGEQNCLICDDCEGKMLLRCVNCLCLYQQPNWYYGDQEGKGMPRCYTIQLQVLTISAADNFMCNRCNVRKSALQPSATVENKRHTYTHILVRCKAECEDDRDLSTEDRIALLAAWIVRPFISSYI